MGSPQTDPESQVTSRRTKVVPSNLPAEAEQEKEEEEEETEEDWVFVCVCESGFVILDVFQNSLKTCDKFKSKLW